VTRSEFELWVNAPDTTKVLKIINEQCKQYEDALVSGSYAAEDTMEKVAGKYIDASAYVRGLRFIMQDVVNYLEEDNVR